MKLPRWLVIGMLTSSVLAVLAAAGWWWVTWPERTAREFVELLSAHRLKQAQAMMGQGYPDRWTPVALVVPPSRWTELETLPRSAWDVAIGQGRYRIPSRGSGTYVPEERDRPIPDEDVSYDTHEFEFIARRGNIAENWRVVVWVDMFVLQDREIGVRKADGQSATYLHMLRIR